MSKRLLFLLAIACYSVSFAQESEVEKADVAFAIIENVPVYPGCTQNGNEELKKCMSDKISEFVNLHFDMKKIEAMDLPPKIYRSSVKFKIDKQGNIVDVHARADYPEIENEAVRVVSDLPQMIPGNHRGKEVGVLYSLPIIFKIEPPAKTKKQNKRNRKS